MSETKRLYRSTTNRMLGGVCSGLADYLGIDPIPVRQAFEVLTLVAGLSIVVYMIMWIVVPEENSSAPRSNAPRSHSVPDRPLQPDHVLQGRYRILGAIGRRGMDAVYQARDLSFPTFTKLVAVKEMINLAQDQQLRETTMHNFEREAEILATLDPSAIPQIYDYFSCGDRAYLVMEFIQGKDLEAILNSTGHLLPVDQIREWAIEICNVLSYLHNHQPEPIVFRDMKPSNVMIDHHRSVRLIDFGIAKTFQMGQPGTMTIGIEGYAAPEAYEGLATPASDIYSLGVTLHHSLTLRDPHVELPLRFTSGLSAKPTLK